MRAASADAAARWRRWRAPLIGTAAAALLWIPLLDQAERSVFALVPVLDEVWYLDRAAELDGRFASPAGQAHFMSPLYPILVKLAGADHPVPVDRVVPPAVLRGLRLVQIACWLTVACLLRFSAGRLLPPGAPHRAALVWMPTLVWVLYRPAAVYTLGVLLELPLALCVTCGLALLVVLPDSRRPLALAAAAGVFCGLAGLLRGTALVLVPAAAWWVGVRASRQRPLAAGLLLAGAFVVLAPAALHNTRASGRLAGPTLNAGVNLMIGNGPEANGFYVAVIDGDWRADPAGTEQLAGELGRDSLSLAAADREWTRRALAEIVAHPWRTAGLWVKKVWLHLQAWEIDQLTPLAGWTSTVPLLRVLVVPWALIVLLAAAGAADLVTGRRAGPWTVPLIAAGLLIAAQSVFFVVSRYRLALLPALALLAAAGAVALLDRRRVAWCAVPAAALLVVPWNLDGVRAQWRAMGLANEALRRTELALARDDAAGLAHAEELYREALAGGAPGEAPWLGLAAVLVAQGDQQAAGQVLAQGARRVNRAPGLHKRLATRALAADDPATASVHLREVLRLRPRDADSLHNLSIVESQRGAWEAAEDLARRLVAAHPDDPRGWNDLGVILARRGRRDEAAAVFRQGLEILPGHPDLTANLARVAADSL